MSAEDAFDDTAAAWNATLTLAARIEAALDGDRQAARFVLLYAQQYLAAGVDLPEELRLYFAEALREIVWDDLAAAKALNLEGRGRRAREASKAAGCEHSERGRAKVPADRDAVLAFAVALRLDSGKSLESNRHGAGIFADVAKQWAVSESEVKRAWQRSKTVPPLASDDSE